MKNYLLISLLLFSISTVVGCSNETERVINNALGDAEFTQEEKTRPVPEVISVEEMFYGLADDLVGRKAHITNGYLSNLNELNKRKSRSTDKSEIFDTEIDDIGNVVLVEDLGSTIKDVEPYYYYIDVVNADGDILATGDIYAMADDENPGGIAEISYTGEQTLPTRCLKKEDAVKLIRERVGIDDTSNILVKAVYVPVGGSFFRGSWGWAVKVNKPVKIKIASKGNIGTQLFWVSSKVFQIEKAKKKGMETDWLKDKVKIAILTEDVFTKDTRNVSKEGKHKLGFCKLIPVEYVVQ